MKILILIPVEIWGMPSLIRQTIKKRIEKLIPEEEDFCIGVIGMNLDGHKFFHVASFKTPEERIIPISALSSLNRNPVLFNRQAIIDA